MSFYSDIMLMSGKRAYNMLKKAWKKDGFTPVLDKQCDESKFMAVKFERINNFGLGSELHHVLKGLEYMESEKETYAVKAIDVNENSTCDYYQNEIGAEIFEDFDVVISFHVPERFGAGKKEEVEVKKHSFSEEQLLNIKGVLETTANLLSNNLENDEENDILTHVMSSLSMIDEPDVVEDVVENLFGIIYKWAQGYVDDGPVNDYEVVMDDIKDIWESI